MLHDLLPTLDFLRDSAWHYLGAQGLISLFVLLVVAGAWVSRQAVASAVGWRLRCPHCGRTGNAARRGVIRVWAASSGKRVFGTCSGCGHGRWLVVERQPRHMAVS